MLGRASLLAAATLAVGGCGKTSSNGAVPVSSGAAGEGSSSSGGDAGAGTGEGSMGGADAGGPATGGASMGGTAPTCTAPELWRCLGECDDFRTSVENCGHCGNSCLDELECASGRCRAPLACVPETSMYEAEAMDRTGGSADGDGWLLNVNETLSASHTFQGGPVVFRITARGQKDAPRPLIGIGVGSDVLGPLRLRSADDVTYSIEYQSTAGAEVVSIATQPELDNDAPTAIINRLEIQDCSEHHGLCDGGGYHLPEIAACAPPVCSEASDCHRDFPGPAFAGECEEGACRYPRCDEPTNNGVPLYEELASMGLAVAFSCIPYEQLLLPSNTPRTPFLEGTPDDFECPNIEELTWEIQRFTGEGSCVTVPVCGPGGVSEVDFAPEGTCCYLIHRVCGV